MLKLREVIVSQSGFFQDFQSKQSLDVCHQVFRRSGENLGGETFLQKAAPSTVIETGR